MLQQDFHRGNNPAYDRVAFVAEHYEELVFMYKDILEHLKQGGTGTGGGCTHISKQIESPYGFVQLDKESFKLMGYDLDNPDDIQFLLHNTFIGMEGHYGNAYTDYASSSGMEYHDTYEVNVGELDTIFVRDPDLDNLLSNPSMLQEIDRVRISYYDQDNNQEVVREFYKFHNNEAFANKENWLQTLYLRLSRNYVDAVQNKPITIKLTSSEYIDGYGYKELYTKASDSVENNPIYIVKIPEKIVTYNNVVLFPVEVSPSYAAYPETFSFKIKYMTKPYLREEVDIFGWGDIITCKKSTNREEGLSYLSADLPIIKYSPTDMHTFTYTIDPDIKDDC